MTLSSRENFTPPCATLRLGPNRSERRYHGTGIRPGDKLEEEGRDETTLVLLLGVPEVEEKVGHQS